MALRGDLASVDLAQVFQMLALNQKVGLLSIQSTRLWKVLYFDKRGVTVHHNVHRLLDRVVTSLVRVGRLTEAQVEEVREHAARMAQPLTDSLLAGGYLQEAELEDQYRCELEEQIYDLFFCKDARFEFFEETDRIDGREGAIDERFFFNCESVIMEAARRFDEWAYISERVPTTAEVLVATAESIDSDQFGNDGPAVFQLLDGRRNVARVVEMTGLSTFQVSKVLSKMLDGAVIAAVAAEQLVPMADQCLVECRLQDAINLYERAIGLGIGLPGTHSVAAHAYQAAEQYENAVYHLECEAECRIAAGDLAGAAQRLFEAKNLVPTDLSARERLVELTIGEQAVQVANFDPMAEGKQLVDLLIEFGDIKRVRLLLERLLLVAPQDPDLKKALVNVHIKAGDQKRVVELYESIADDLVRAGRPLEAVGYLQKILLIDRSRADVSERVRHLFESDERSRRRSRTLGALAVVFCLLLVGGAGYWFYNQRAAEDFARIDVKELVDREDFAGAATAYLDFVHNHPLATVVARAEAELQQIEASRQRFEARRSAERAGRERELQRIRSEYKVEWTRHREQFMAGHPETSMEALTRTRELIEKAGTADDMAWALVQQVERTWQRLRDYLGEAEKLGASYDRHLAALEWEQARVIALRLHAEFENTASARRAAVPVMVHTRPAGARLLVSGKPMERIVDGKVEVLRTPTMVLCPVGAEPLVFDAELEGFAPRRVSIESGKRAVTDVVLEVIANRRIAFPALAQTGVGLADGWLAVGLRGGRVGISRIDGTETRLVELGGLKSAESTPVVQNGRVFFVTNENTIECLAADPSVAVSGWPVQLAGGTATELTVRDGRVCVVDREFVVHCWEQSTAGRLWSLPLGCAPGGPPSIDQRQVYVTTTDGRVMILDAVDGRTITVLRSQSPITSRALVEGGNLFFGCADNSIRAVDAEEGRLRWIANLGRTPADGEIVLAAGCVLVTGPDGHLDGFDQETGNPVGRVELSGTPQRGLRSLGDRVFVQVRRSKTRTTPAHDVLLAVSVEPLSLLWEYVDQGLAPGLHGVDSAVIAWPSAVGEVVLFR